MQSLKVHIAEVQDVEGAGLGNELIENLHVSKLAIANPDEGWNIAVQVQQGVHLHGALTLTEASPWEHRQAEIDRSGVQSVGAQSEFLAEGIIQVECAGAANDNLREV